MAKITTNLKALGAMTSVTLGSIFVAVGLLALLGVALGGLNEGEGVYFIIGSIGVYVLPSIFFWTVAVLLTNSVLDEYVATVRTRR